MSDEERHALEHGAERLRAAEAGLRDGALGTSPDERRIMSWLLYALVSAVAAALTAILAKVGVEGVPSNLATAIRTVVITVFAWGIIAATAEYRALPGVSRRSIVFLLLSGITTGISWLAYFRALQLGPASRVSPIDKLSLPLTIVLAAVFLHEPVGWRLGLGVALMTIGALLTIG
jgi:transporter family protein